MVFEAISIAVTSIMIIIIITTVKLEGNTFSNNSAIRIRSVIIVIPIPITRHSFFSLYFAFSSFDAVLYPAISQLPCPKSKVMDMIVRIKNITQNIQSGPWDTSASFITAPPIMGMIFPENKDFSFLTV